MNKAARLVKRLSPYDRVTPALIDLHWLPITARVIFKICVLCYQAVSTGKPDYLKNLLKPFVNNANVSVRHSYDVYRLHEPRCNAVIGTRAFRYIAPRLYNRLPQNVKCSENVHTFKRRLKIFLFTDCYDMEDETIKEFYVV